MSRFLDGHIAGTDVTHSRAPLFLRVVVDRSGAIDVLDQIDDAPREDESVLVYQQVPGTRSQSFACARSGGLSSHTESADYTYRHDVDAIKMRDNDEWRRWAESTPAFMLGDYGMLRGGNENDGWLMPAAGIIARERNRMGFVWLGTCETDGRQPGPPTLAWGVLPDDSVMVSIVREYGATSWEPITREEWGERWPHSNPPAHLPGEA